MLSLEALGAEIDALLADLDRAEADPASEIAAVAPEHRDGAVNLVHYTTLRQRDLRELQNDLLDIGATSLATTEADVDRHTEVFREAVADLMAGT